jgi:hypothetical protein
MILKLFSFSFLSCELELIILKNELAYLKLWRRSYDFWKWVCIFYLELFELKAIIKRRFKKVKNQIDNLTSNHWILNLS